MKRADADAPTLRRSAAQSVKWSIVQTVGAQPLRLLFTFVLARMVGPDGFGIMAEATIYVAFVMLLLDQGFASALIQRKDLTRTDIGSAGWLNVTAAVVLVAVTMAVAPQVAAFFDEPELAAVLRVLTIDVLVKGLSVVPLAMMARDLRFRERAVITLVAACVGGAAGVAHAYAGGDYWSLVVQVIVTDAVVLAGAMALQGPPPLAASWASLRSMWSFGASLMAAQMLIFIGNNADNVLVGRFLGSRQLAYYALSYRFLRLPIQIVGSTVNTVALPVFSRLQDDRERLQRWYMVATRSVALASFPVFTTLIVGADDFIEVLFGPAWGPAVSPLRWLALAGLLRIVRMLMGPLCTANGRTDLVLRWSVINVGVALVGFVVGLRFGITGIAIGYATSQLLTALPQFLHIGRVFGLALRRYVGALVAPVAGSVALALGWAAVRAGMAAADVPTTPAFAAATLAGLAVYAAVVRLGWPSTVEEGRDILRLMASRGGGRRSGAPPTGAEPAS